jgi:hypothetical protein
VIRFRFSKKEGRLTAHASAPLLIENKALGYRVRYDFETFSYDSKTRVVLYTGYPFFEQLPGRERRRATWQKKRQEVYGGSIMHFMRSIYRNTLHQEGFEVRRLQKIRNEEKDRVRDAYRQQAENSRAGNAIIIGAVNNMPDSSDYYNYVLGQPDYRDVLGRDVLPGDSIAFALDSVTAGLYFPDYLWIWYKSGKVPQRYQRLFPAGAQGMMSQVQLLDDDVLAIQANGMYYNPVNMVSSGYWGWSEKISTMLPFDYRSGD